MAIRTASPWSIAGVVQRSLGLPLLLCLCAGALAGAGGCESSDPCLLRQAACLDVMLIGKLPPTYYTDITVQVTTGSGAALAPPQTVATLKATAPAGVQGIVSFKLADDFNNQPDLFSKDERDRPGSQASMIDGLGSDDAKKAAFMALRATDPRYIHVTVTGTEKQGDSDKSTPVKWDSVDDESHFSNDQWLIQHYYRVGKNQYAAAYALLAPTM